MADRIKTWPEVMFRDARRPRKDFREVNPDQFGRADGNRDAVRRLASIETRAAEIKERLRAHVARHEKLWITNEAGRLLQKRAAASVTAPPMKVSAHEALATVTQEAARNVRVRVLHRMMGVNAAKARMQNTIIRSTVLKPDKPTQKPQQLKNAFRRVNRPKV